MPVREAGPGKAYDLTIPKEPEKTWRRPRENASDEELMSLLGDDGNGRILFDMIKYGSQVPGGTARLSGG